MRIDKYLRSDSVSFPIYHSQGAVPPISEVTMTCPVCKHLARDIRGTVVEFRDCLDIKLAGMCHPCRKLVSLDFRHHKWGALVKTLNGWVERKASNHWWHRFFPEKSRQLQLM